MNLLGEIIQQDGHHGGAAGTIAATQVQGPSFDPCCSPYGRHQTKKHDDK